MTEEEAADKAKERIIEINSRLYDRAAAYANLILLGGYAGAFTIWNITKQQLGDKITIIVALLLGTSLSVFIFFEVYKMVVNALRIKKIAALLSQATSSLDFIERYKKAEQELNKHIIASYWVWALCLFICVASALSAIGILFFKFLMLTLPGWEKA